jgi:hypothetical protein
MEGRELNNGACLSRLKQPARYAPSVAALGVDLPRRLTCRTCHGVAGPNLLPAGPVDFDSSDTAYDLRPIFAN